MNTVFTKLFSFLLIFFISFSLLAQKASLQGTLTDSDTNEALIGVSIKVDNTGTVSDIDGNYKIQLTAGTHTVEYSYIGYKTLTETITLVENEKRLLNLTLSSQTSILQTATVTSGKFEKPLSEVTVSMEVIKPKLIENTNTTSVDEVLGKVPGVNVIDGQANIRGGSGWSYGAGSRVLLLVDNIPALQADAGFPQWDDIPVESIERMEVVKGASSALYGSSAMNGIINILTSYAKSKPETKLSTFYTAYLDPKDKAKKWWDNSNRPFEAGGSVAHRQKLNKLDLVAGAYYIKRNSFRELTGNNYGRFNFKTRYRISDRFLIGFSSNFNKVNNSSYFYWKGIECDSTTSCGTYLADTSSLTITNSFRFNVDPFISYFDKKGNRHKFLGRYHYIDNNALNNQSNSSRLKYGEYQFQKNFKKIDLVTTMGLVGIHSKVEAELYGGTYGLLNLAAYFQADKKLFDKLNLSAGFRYEQNTINKDTILYKEAKPVFRLGLNYKLTDYTFIRASWGQGYRFPTLAEFAINTQAGEIKVVPNPALRSETGWSGEIGVKQGFKISEWEGFIDLAGFWSEYQDMMEYTLVIDFTQFPIEQAFQSQNVGNTIIKGLDFSIAGRGKLFGLPTSVLAGYTLLDPKFKQFDNTGKADHFILDIGSATEAQRNAANSTADENFLKYRSKHAFKLDIETEIKHFTIGLAFNYGSRIVAVDRLLGDEDLAFIAEGSIGQYRKQNPNGYKTFNARLAYQFNNKIKLALLAKNLMNEEYMLRPGLLEAPRSLGLRLDLNF